MAVGLYVRADTSPPLSPEAGKTWWFDLTNNALKLWSGTAWVSVVGGQALPSYALASLPPAGTAGRLARVTDDVRGTFLDTGSAWRQLQGNIANVLDWGTNAAALQAAHDSLPSTGGTILIPSDTTVALGTTRVNFSKNIVLMGFGWTSKISADVTTLSNPGGNDLGILNIRFSTDTDTLDYVKVYNLWFDFGGSRASSYAEGRRGLNIYRADNIDIRGCQFKGGVGEMVGLGNMGPTIIGNRAWIIGNYFTDFAQDGLNPNVFEVLVHGNHFLTGESPIEAGRSRFVATNNTFDDMNSAFKIASLNGFLVKGNYFRECAKTNTGGVVGCINVVEQGGGARSENGIILGNSFDNTTTHANLAGIHFALGAAAANTNINVIGNEMSGLRNGIYFGNSITNSLFTGNIIKGGVQGITIPNDANVTGNRVFGNYVTGASTIDIEDLSADTRNNIVGWNEQTNGRIYGQSGTLSFADLDATPSVRRGLVFVGSYSGATTITNFDDGVAGQEITILFTGATPNITVQDNVNVQLSGGVNFVSTTDDSLTLVLQGTVWREKSRSLN